ncbi:MAG: 50S ribosomal protein L4 [Clostridiales bacterium]|nr:50S ribosomal protein L4 [Clostridiales bacterium]
MPKFRVYNLSGEGVEEIELNESVFGIKPNVPVMHEVVKNYLANNRQGTQSAKTRAEVRGGGKKPFRQKGTGNARQGTIRAPHYVGGGVAFAPKPRNYGFKVSKKVRRLAMRSALSSKVIDAELKIVNEFKLDEIKTKNVVSILKAIDAQGKALIVTAGKDDKVIKSSSNIPGVSTSFVDVLNVYDVLNHEYLILSLDAVKKIEEAYA